MPQSHGVLHMQSCLLHYEKKAWTAFVFSLLCGMKKNVGIEGKDEEKVLFVFSSPPPLHVMYTRAGHPEVAVVELIYSMTLFCVWPEKKYPDIFNSTATLSIS